MRKKFKNINRSKNHNNKMVYKVSKGLRALPVKQRLGVFLIFLSLVPFILVGIISYNISETAIKSKIDTYSAELIRQLSKNIENALKEAQGYGNEVALSASINNKLVDFSKADEYEKLQLTKEIGDTISQSLVAATTIDELYIYTSDHIVIRPGTNQQGAASVDSFTNEEKQQAIKLASEAKGKTIFYYGKLAKENSLVFVKAMRLAVQDDGQEIGYVFTRYPVKEINHLYDDMQIGNGANITVIDTKGEVISSNNKEMVVGETYDAYTKANLINNLNKRKSENNFIFDSTINGKKYLVAFSYLEKYEWYVVSTIPYTYLNLESNRIRNIMLIVGIGCVMIVLLLAYLISRSISEPLKKITYLIGEVEQGNLCASVTDESKDEMSKVIKQSNSMVNHVRNLITKVNETVISVKKSAENIALFSKEVSCSSDQIMQSVYGIAEGTTKQAREVSESVAHVEHLSFCIDKVSEDIEKSNETIDSTKKISSSTVGILDELNQKTESTGSTFEKIMCEVESLNASMKEISSITSLIGSIAEQTNLLSLNASIEAARAGTVGKGFEVVAGEIKKLSDQSKDASISISSIIKKAEQNMKKTIVSANDTHTSIKEQLEAVHQVNTTFMLILGVMDDIKRQLENVDSSVKEMHSLKGITLSAIEKISVVSEETATSAEEVAATTKKQALNAEELNQYIKLLNTMTADLTLSIERFKV